MQEDVEALVRACPDVRWGLSIRIDGRPVAAVDAQVRLASASIGKVLLLVEVARQIEAGTLDPHARLASLEGDRVADSGLWQHLPEPDLAVESLAVLVASVSDNTATNVLLRRVGPDAVTALSDGLGMPETALVDRIRDVRRPPHPSAPSFARADDLVRLMDGLASGTVVSPQVSALVVGWLATGTDLSMVASAFALDPLAHADGPVRLFHKTGSDAGVRADAGHVVGPTAAADYAVLAQWEPLPEPQDARQAAQVRDVMRAIGALVDARIR